ncbi:MAG TPA: hypothetical protein VFW07_06510 [Parafilimonas sp.]|nr:hypothetical protein [Parafilimonas sp.]
MKLFNQISGLYFLLVTSAGISYGHCNAGSGNDSPSSKVATNENISQKEFTPEMFGAIGDGQIHELSSQYNSLDEARKKFPNIRDLNITIDGAAFQEAVDAASKSGGTVVARKKYAINFPIITRDNVTIDGQNEGVIYNDRSRKQNVFHLAFFVGNHSASAFYKSADNSSYKLYDVAGSITAGQDFVRLGKPSDISAFKTGQLVMVVSSFKRRQKQKKTGLPYHITISKITKVQDGKLYFEYPIDENVDSAEVAANGGFDNMTGMNYGGVSNVTIKNFTINAAQITQRAYGYKVHISNMKVNNAIRLVGINAIAHSSFTNISGSFGWRCIEVKTGTSDVLIKNINAVYQPLADKGVLVDAIAIGEYNRDVTIDSFKIDFKNTGSKLPTINLHSRKATISNGEIISPMQTTGFLKFYNERYVENPNFGCYGNTVNNVKFYGSNMMKNVMQVGEDDKEKKASGNKADNWAYQKNQKKKANASFNDDNGDNDNLLSDEDATANVPPSSNIVENCLFDAGSGSSFADLVQGKQNVIRNCTFTKARLKLSDNFRANNNNVDNNKALK